MANAERPQVPEKTAWVIASDPDVGQQLEAGLNGADCRTQLFLPDQQSPDSDGNLLSSVAKAIDESSWPDLILIALLPNSLFPSQRVEDVMPDEWRARVHAPIMLLFHVMAKLGSALGGKAATVVVIGPTLGHVGGVGMGPLCTVLEAQRGMVKSAARQWGERGATISWMGVAPEAYDASLADVDRTTGPEFGPAHRAIGRVPTLSEAAQVAKLLATPAGRLITGHTINVDGGEWMLP